MTFLLRQLRRWSRPAALMCLLLLSATPPTVHAQVNSTNEALKGTLCESPQDENTKSACGMAMVQCSLASAMYGRTDEERNLMLRNCVQKTAKQARRAMDAQGDAVRREYGGETDAQVAADLAAKKAAREKAATAAATAQAQRQKEWQDRLDAIKQSCSTGQGTLIVTSGPAKLNGQNLRPLDYWVYRDQVVHPIADPDAPVHGQCLIQFTRDGHTITGKISILDLALN